MRSASEITVAIESILNSYPALSNTTIERSVRVNMDPAIMPWCGVYPGRRDIDPATLGGCTRRWRSSPSPKLVLQEYGYDDEGQTASDALDALIVNVLDAISGEHNTGLNFGLDGVRLIGISIEYTYVLTDEDEEGSIFFPQAEITLNLEDR